MDLTELSARLGARDITSEEVVGGYLNRIKAYDGMLNSYITVCAEEALDAARAADRQQFQGRLTHTHARAATEPTR